jgi:hypothetical protein
MTSVAVIVLWFACFWMPAAAGQQVHIQTDQHEIQACKNTVAALDDEGDSHHLYRYTAATSEPVEADDIETPAEGGSRILLTLEDSRPGASNREPSQAS